MMARVRNCLLLLLLALLAGSIAVAAWKVVALLDRDEDALILAEDTLNNRSRSPGRTAHLSSRAVQDGGSGTPTAWAR